jgi:NitT/TauT family transport system substrate-binding protein
MLALACQPAAAPSGTPQPAATAPAAAPPGAAPGSAAQRVAPARPDQILIALDWVIAGEHSPFFVALDKGFYAEQNLAAQIARGYGSADTVKRIAAKQADFGQADPGSLIAARANDDVRVKLISAVFGEAAMTIIYNARQGIAKPKDLEDKTIAAGAGSATPRLFPAFAKANGIDPARVNWMFVEPASVNSLFAAGRADAVGLFVVQVPLLRALTKDNRDIEVGYMRYADYGLKFYGNGLIAHEDMIQANPELTRRFVAATLRGYEYAVNNPDEAVAIFGKYQRDTPPPQVREELLLVKDLVYSEEARAHGIGTLDPAKVANTIELVTEGLELRRKLAPEELYTTQFLPSR